MSEIRKKIIPDKTSPRKSVASDTELERFKELTQSVAKSYEEGYVIESFVIAYQIVQEIMLPILRERTLKQLGLKKLSKKFEDEKNAYSANLEYVALTHDTELFELLEEARKIRNNLVYKLTAHESLKKSKAIARSGVKNVILKLFTAIQNRWDGKKPIPVLTLYAKGWNDCREETIKRINES